MLFGQEIKHQEGIILKNYNPYKQQCTILDRSRGKIYGRVRTWTLLDPLRVGSIIMYSGIARNELIIHLQEINIIKMPTHLEYEDIYFLHHVLELCYYFLPENGACPTIFDLLFFLLNYSQRVQYSVHKQLILMRFFVCLGMYPDDEELQEPIRLVLQQPLEEMNSDPITKKTYTLLGKWLRQCIVNHPYKNRFKTIERGEFGYE